MNEVKAADFYDRIYKKKSWGYFKRYHVLYRTAAEFITRNDIVLELGCGMGTFAGEYYAKRCQDFRAIDFSNVGISMAKKKWPKFNKNFLLMDFSKLVSYKFHYTVVCALEVLEHIDKDIELLGTLKKGTLVLLSVPKTEKIVRGKPKGWPVHRRSYSVPTIKNRYGKIIDIKQIIPIVSWFLIVGRVM